MSAKNTKLRGSSNPFNDSLFPLNEDKAWNSIMDYLLIIAPKMVQIEKGVSGIQLTREESFAMEAYFLYRELQKKFEDLYTSSHLINFYPNGVKVSSYFTREKYILYHLEYYYIGIVAIFDRLLKLVNFLFDLGLADKYCTLDAICTNAKVSKEVKNKLKILDRAIQEMRSLQNTIKHKRGLREIGMHEAATMEFVARNLHDKFSKSELSEIQKGSKYFYKKYLKEKRKEIDATNEKLVLLILSVTKAMEVNFFERLNLVKGN